MKKKGLTERIRLRKIYATNRREPFYDVAAKFLPKDKQAVVVDVGSGYGYFADYLKLREKYSNLILLDANPEVAKKVSNSKVYRIPEKLPFQDKTVDYVHVSHLIEHLYVEQLLSFLKEVDRVLKNDGVLIISSPMLDYRFYEGLTHIEPYGPTGLIHFLCSRNEEPPKKEIAPADDGVISNEYIVEDLIYRYARNLDSSSWGSRYYLVSLLMELIKKALFVLGFERYSKNGYTLVLRKNSKP